MFSELAAAADDGVSEEVPEVLYPIDYADKGWRSPPQRKPPVKVNGWKSIMPDNTTCLVMGPDGVVRHGSCSGVEPTPAPKTTVTPAPTPAPVTTATPVTTTSSGASYLPWLIVGGFVLFAFSGGGK